MLDSIVHDNNLDLKKAVNASLQVSDMVIVNAGTSAGTEDHTAEVLANLGDLLAHGVAIKPGKPVVLAVCQEKPVIGLPGYPVSAMLTAELFVRDLLFVRQKMPVPQAIMLTASLARQVPSSIGVEEFIRTSVGYVRGRMVATPLGRGAGLISSLSKAQGIFSVDQTSSGLSAGAAVTVRFIRVFLSS